MINIKQVEALDMICDRYKIKKVCAMNKLIDIEEHISIRYGLNDFNRSYFYLALGHLNHYYKFASELW